jgi:triacylglycerol esterase/lipase EstA (alpha/beta hydrolase family)
MAPSSVVLIGHSLGGLVAKSLLVSPAVSPSSVQVIITLATPHTPVVLMDAHKHNFYDKVP